MVAIALATKKKDGEYGKIRVRPTLRTDSMGTTRGDRVERRTEAIRPESKPSSEGWAGEMAVDG